MALALLAPVPLIHLEDGVEVCEREGRVAFGSNAWEVFRRLDDEAASRTPVLIYASHAAVTGRPRVTWMASYLRYVESKGGAHPDRSRFRPRSTIENHEDTTGHWAGFYEVEGLHRLAKDDCLEVRELRDRNGRRYRRDFVPEGPILVSFP